MCASCDDKFTASTTSSVDGYGEMKLFCLCLTPESPDTCIVEWNVNCPIALNCDELEPRGNWMKIYFSLSLSLSLLIMCIEFVTHSSIYESTFQLFNFLSLSLFPHLTAVTLWTSLSFTLVNWKYFHLFLLSLCVSLWVLYFIFPLDSSTCIQITCFHGELVSSSSLFVSSFVRFVHFVAFFLKLSSDTLHFLFSLPPPW